MEFRKTLASTAVAFALVGFAGAPAVAGTIESWNTGNVVTTPELDADGNGFSYIYDQPTAEGIGNTSAYIKFTPPETESPGLEVENDSAPADDATSYSGSDVANCILSAGPSSCNSEFQSGKRFKLDRTAFDPVDLVFNVDPAGTFDDTYGENDGLYKVFQKYGNNTDARIESFTVELGFGIGGDFVASGDGDGLGFVDFGPDPKNNEFSSLFAAGLFGKADGDKHLLDGYFSDKRTGFNLDFSEDLIASAGIFGVYDDLFGDWLSYSQVPDGYFYDDDGDASTDAILMANQEADGTWSVNRGILADGSVVTLADADKLTDLSLAEVEEALNAEFTAPSCLTADAGVPCLAGVDAIEDLAKFNLTYFIDQILLDPTAIVDETGLTMGDLLATAYGANTPTFTLRISAVEAVPAPGVLSLLGLGLLGLFGARRRLA
jgi:hypothetical protein